MKKLMVIVVALFVFTIPAYAQTPTPIVPLPDEEMNEAIVEANDAVTSAEFNSSLIPSGDLYTLFGYAKWFFSPYTGEEIAGPFAPFFWLSGLFVGMMVAGGIVYVAVYLGVYLMKWVIWLFRLALSIIDLVLQVLQVAASLLGKVVGTVVDAIVGAIRAVIGL